MSRKSICLLILFLWILSYLFLVRFDSSVRAGPSTRFVPSSNSTIQEAINNANDGDTIIVAAGTYCEHIVLNKAVTLRGESSSSRIVGVIDNEPVILVNATDVQVYGLIIQGALGYGKAGILLDNCSFCQVFQNTVINNSYGIVLKNCSKCMVHDNNVTGNVVCGIRVENSEFCDIGSRGEGAFEGPNIVNDNGQWLDPTGGGIGLIDCSSCFVGLNNLNNNSESGILLNRCNSTEVYAARVTNSSQGGIYLWYCNQCNVLASYLKNNASATDYRLGVSVEYSQDCIIAANRIYNSTTGVDILRSQNCQIIDENNIAYCGQAVSVEESSHMRIAENFLFGNSGGVICLNSNDSMVITNDISNTYNGISFYEDSNWTVAYNNIGGNSEGISVEWSLGCQIYENEITNNTVGVSLKQYVENYEIFENRIYNNSVGISLACDKITFHRNIFFNNTKHVENMLLNETGKGYNDWNDGKGIGNYWGDYQGYDDDGDGVGESPYVIDMKNRDYYPLIGGPGDDYRPPIIMDCRITNILSNSNPQLVNPFDVVKIRAMIVDQQSGVNELTLLYGKEYLNYSVKMIRVAGDFFNGTYEGWICPWTFFGRDEQGLISRAIDIPYQVEAVDFAGNVADSERLTFSAAEPSNSLNMDIVISQVNTQDELSVDLDFTLDGYLPAWIGNTFYVEVENWQGSTKLNSIQLSTSPLLLNGQRTLNYSETFRCRLSLIGRSENYPFDSYYLNLTFRFSPSLPYYLADSYWSNIYSDACSLITENFDKWANVTLSVEMPHYVQQGLVSTWGYPEPKVEYAYSSNNETAGFDTNFVLVRQLNNVLPLLLLIISTTYMLGATLLADARWNPEVKTAIYLSFFVMVAGFNFALRYLIPFRYGLTVAEVLFITLTVATAVFSIGVVVSSILFTKISEKKARKANSIIDFSAICLSAILLAIFSVPISLVAIEVAGLFFGFVIRISFLDRTRETTFQPQLERA